MSASDLQGEYPVISFASLQMGICPDTRRSPFLPVHLFFTCAMPVLVVILVMVQSMSAMISVDWSFIRDIMLLSARPSSFSFYLNDQPAAIYGSRYPYDPVICAP